MSCSALVARRHESLAGLPRGAAVAVRTRSVIYAHEPAGSAGLRALRRQLSRRGDAAPADTLGPVSALLELDAVCAGMLAGRGGPNQTNRSSLVDDLQRALGALGPETRKEAGQTLESFQRDLKKLGRRLDSTQGARVAALSLRVMLDQLKSEALVAAAWQDAVAVFDDVEASAERCELRLRQLVELAEHRGVDYADWALIAELILGDDARAEPVKLGETLGVVN